MALIAFVLFALFSLGALAEDNPNLPTEADADRVSAILFPQSRDWQAVDQLSHPSETALNSSLEKITTALKKEGININSSDEKIFLKTDFFREISSNNKNLYYIFSAPDPTSEGKIGALIDISQDKNFTAIEAGDILRLDVNHHTRFIEFWSGCCADKTDEYMSITYVNTVPYTGESIKVTKSLSIPTNSTFKNQPITAKNPIVIRDSPEKDDTIDTTASDGPWGQELHGNILQEYNSGAEATEIAKYIDPKGDTWFLIKLGAEQAGLLSYNLIGAQSWAPHSYPLPISFVGWVEADCLEHACQNPDLK